MEKQSVCSDIIEVLKHYKKLSNFIEDEVPYTIAEDIRQDLYLYTYINELIDRLKALEATR